MRKGRRHRRVLRAIQDYKCLIIDRCKELELGRKDKTLYPGKPLKAKLTPYATRVLRQYFYDRAEILRRESLFTKKYKRIIFYNFNVAARLC